MGQAFGVAIGGTVFQNQFDGFVSRAVAEGKIGRDFVITGAEAAGAYRVIGGFPEVVVEAYRFVYADALRIVWWVTMSLAALAGLVSLVVKNVSMDRGNRAKQGFKHEVKSEKLEGA